MQHKDKPITPIYESAPKSPQLVNEQGSLWANLFQASVHDKQSHFLLRSFQDFQPSQPLKFQQDTN